MPEQVLDPLTSWQPFIKELQESILPVYLHHEQDFDAVGIHGRMHICRALLFAECMARFYREHTGAAIDFDAVRLAIAWHGSGRQGNGKDIWEADSAANCAAYTRRQRPDWDEARCTYIGSLITSRLHGDIHAQLVHDADVLEIMRPCCGHGGLPLFRRGFMRFLGHQDPLSEPIPDRYDRREALVQEAWSWITWTEDMKARFRTETAYMEALLNELRQEHARFPLLATLL
jgi:hypothetical protein